ncbi:MAG TPA: penicillin acylase family protein [Vicinamibacterales bacterium]|nr:penicillin acylase family protein [Vicinamibacterales bacterium]
MRASLQRVAAVLAGTVLLCGCRTEPAPPHGPQTTGTVRAHGLSAPVTVRRDHWGIPHIAAQTADDLFFAQGYVQAQDRLFQMDLWKRSVQGRLSEVLGANFIQRDSMTRRIQFRGDYAREWASYGEETHRIAVAFTNGVNAWVRAARDDVPEEFAAAGWTPEFWKPEDLLNRTDGFLSSGDAAGDLFRARLVAALGVDRANLLFPLPGRQRFVPEAGVDLAGVTFVVADALRRIGTPPFFLTLTGTVSDAPRPGQPAAAGGGPVQPPALTPTAPDTNAVKRAPLVVGGRTWLVDAAVSGTGAPLVGASLASPLAAPSARYLVHLTAPGWNVIGATAPWLPGVVIGHNDRLAWAMTPVAADTQDIFIERVNPNDPQQVEHEGRWVDMAIDHDRLEVKGRARPVEYDRQYTPNGVVVAQDRERHLVYTLRWVGTEPGGAAELAALALGRASSVADFTTALSRWKMPVAEFVYADAAGQAVRALAGLRPVRSAGSGWLPMAGWSSARTWLGFDDRVRPIDADARASVSSVDDLVKVQSDVSSPQARTLLALLDQIRSFPGNVEPVRARLLSWDGRFDGSSLQASAYLAFDAALRELIAKRAGVPPDLIADVAQRIDPVSLLVRPSKGWFQERSETLRRDVLSNALAMVDGQTPTPQVMFAHPLGVFEQAGRRFNVGPYPAPGFADSIFGSDGQSASVFRVVFDVGNWNRSVATNAPGQAGSPASVHYDDLAPGWSAGRYVPLPFDLAGQPALTGSELLTIRPD